MGRRKNREPHFCSFSLPSPLARFLFSLSTASLRRKEASDRGRNDLLPGAVGLWGGGGGRGGGWSHLCTKGATPVVSPCIRTQDFNIHRSIS